MECGNHPGIPLVEKVCPFCDYLYSVCPAPVCSGNSGNCCNECRQHNSAASLEIGHKYPNGVMIQIARGTRGMARWELGRKTKIKTSNIKKFEAREIFPTEEELQSIADATKYPIEFFYREMEKICKPLSIHPPIDFYEEFEKDTIRKAGE